MNQPGTINLFGWQDAAATLRDGSAHRMRVREMPIRHHLDLLELFQEGREADLIERCCERRDGDAWSKVDAAWIDSLDDTSHAALVELATTLNFSRPIATAQRQIARGSQLRPIMQSMAKNMLAPLRQELDSWTSSLTQQLSSALAAKPPSTKT